MVQVENKKMLNGLTNCFIKNYRKNTITIMFAITLTITLAVSLLTLIHTNHWIEAMQNQFIYTNIDFQISNLNNAQIKMLENNDDISKLGIKRYEAVIKNNYQSASVISSNASSALAVSTLLSGKMPGFSNEIAAEKWVLLNLGVNPVVGSEFTFDTTVEGSEKLQPVKYKLVGIINDISLNKLSGSLNLYTALDGAAENDYFAEIKFKNGVNKQAEIQNIKHDLKLADKSISENPWQENKKELIPLDFEIGALLLIICFIILWGIYRISLMVRENQYGILKAVGVTKRQVRKMIISELFKIYLVCIPIGGTCGIASSYFITFLSKNNEINIYFWNKKEAFKMVIPIVPILLTIAGIGIVLMLIALMESHKVNSQTIMSSIIGSTEEDKNHFPVFTINEKKNTFLTERLGFKYIFCKLKTSVIIVLSLSVGGILFYGLSYRAFLSSAETTIKTEESFYNNDYILTANDDMCSTKGITTDTVKQAQKIPGIKDTESQMAMPVKVEDDGTDRIEKYFTDKEKTVQRIYGFPLSNKLGGDTVFHTKLKGYNKEALTNLKKYLVEGNFNPKSMKEDEVIIAMPRMSEYGKSKGKVGFFKQGKPIMNYKIGQSITVKYRTDLDTTSDGYWKCTDKTAPYSTKKYKIAAIVYYPYMKEVSVIEQSYPLLITSEENYSSINPSGVYETVGFNVMDALNKTDKNKTTDTICQDKIEQKLIQLSVKNKQVTARSLIAEKAKLKMMYQKSLVYIYGIAAVTFILILINLVNNLKYRIQTRKSELYIYRAIGMGFRSQLKMIRFENMVFGLLSLLITFLFSQILASYVYTESGIYVYGISYNYSYTIFVILAAVTLLICYTVSTLLCNQLKDESILTELNKIE